MSITPGLNSPQSSPPAIIPPLSALASSVPSNDGVPISSRKPSLPRGKSSSSASSRLRGLYGWGSSNTGQLGSGPEVKERLVPSGLWGFEKVAMFDCAGSHSIVVKRIDNKATEVYAFGRNDAGQCGVGGDDDTSPPPKAVLSPSLVDYLNVQRIIHVACGGAHTAAVTTNGTLFTWGWGLYGQLGHGPDVKEVFKPKDVADLHGIFVSQVSCGGFHTAAVTKLKSLYTFGMGTYGQLGLGDAENRFSPHLVEAFENVPVQEIASGETHMIAISAKGDCYSWGSGDSFQLGHGDKSNELRPRRLEFFKQRGIRAVKASCGFRHSIVVSEDGFAFSWGTGDHGELGLGDAERVKTAPTLIDALGSTTIRAVHASMHFTAFLSDTGDVYICGSRMLGHSSTTTAEFQMIPKRLAVFGEQYVMSLKAGTHHCLAYIDSGELGRNRLIGKIIAAETRYARALSLVAKEITPVAASLVGPTTWQQIVSRMDNIYNMHRKQVLQKLRRMQSSAETPLKISTVYLALFSDSNVLRTYSEYASEVGNGWERFLSCLKARPELATYLERVFGTPAFTHCGLIRSSRSAEQFNLFLQLPTTYFLDLVPLLDELLRATKETSAEYPQLKRLTRKASETAQLVKSSMENNSFSSFLDFLQRYPDCAHLVQSHRRFVASYAFSSHERVRVPHPTHAIYIFNDLVVFTSASAVLHQFDLVHTFIKDVGPAAIQILSPTYTYNLVLDSEKDKAGLVSSLQDATSAWIETRPKLRDARVLAGINLLMADLRQVMPLLSKDWSGQVSVHSPRGSLPSSFGKASGSRALSRRPSSGTDTASETALILPSTKLNSVAIGQSLSDISDLLGRTSTLLEKESVQRERARAPGVPSEQQEKFMIILDPTAMLPTTPSRVGQMASSISRAFGRKSKIKTKSSGSSSSWSLGPTNSLRALGKNFRFAVRVSGDTRVGTAKEALYQAAKASPWAGAYEFAPLWSYVLRIRSLGLVLTAEDLPLSRIPIIQAIFSTTFVTPTIEMVQRSKEIVTIPRVSFESGLQSFDQITDLIGTVKSMLNTQNDEVNSFRHISASHRVKMYELRQTQPNVREKTKWPEYRGLEALPLQLPSTFNITIYLPSLNNEKHTIQVSATDTVLLVCQRIWRYLYKHDKHRGREKFKKFFKGIMDTDAASDTDDDLEQAPPLASNAVSVGGSQSVAVDVDIPQDTFPANESVKSKRSKHKKNQSNTSQDGKDAVTAVTQDEPVEHDLATDRGDPETSPRSARRDKRRASLKTVLEFMKKEDPTSIRSGSITADAEIPSGVTLGPSTAAPLSASGTPTKEKNGKKKNFVSQMFSGSPRVSKREKTAPSSSPRRGSISSSITTPEPVFGVSTYHGPTKSASPPRTEKSDFPSPKRSHRKTHSDDTNLTSSDADNLNRASVSRGTAGAFAGRTRSGSLGDTDDDRLDEMSVGTRLERLTSPLSSSASTLPSQDTKPGSALVPTSTSSKVKRQKLVISSADVPEVETHSLELQSADFKRKDRRVLESTPNQVRRKGSDRVLDSSPAITISETFTTKKSKKHGDDDPDVDAIEIISPGPVRRASKDFITLENRDRGSRGRLNDDKRTDATDEITHDDEETDDIPENASSSDEMPPPSTEDELAAVILGVSDPEAVAVAQEVAQQPDEENQITAGDDDAVTLDPEKQRKLRKEEEKLRKEKEKEEKKIKKEEEKLRKEKEKEDKKKAKREQRDRDLLSPTVVSLSTVDEATSSTPTIIPTEVVPAESSVALEGREKERVLKDDKEKSKKDKAKVQKQPKQKKLSTGRTFEDFILKVYGSREFLLPGDTAALNKLIDYDYICKCINSGSPIDLVYTDKSSVVLTVALGADKDETLIDSSIARECEENEISEVILSADGGQPETSSPFWAFDADIGQFSIRALDCANLRIEPEHLKPNRAVVYMAAGVYYGGRLVAPLRVTSPVAPSSCPVWNEEIIFDVPMRSIPREARLSLSIHLRTDMNKLKRSRVLRSDQPLGWVNIQIFNHVGEIRDGQIALRLWSGEAANPIGTCMENTSLDNPPILYVDLYTNKSNTPNATIRSLPKAIPSTNPASTFSFRKTPAGIALGASGPRSKEHEPSPKEVEELKEIMRRDSLHLLSEDEKELLWNNLAWCKKHPSILPKLLWAVDWTDRSTVSHLHRLLESWPLLHPMDALQLLDFKFPDRTVRNFAVRCLELMNDNDLYRILLQLTQALKFEPYHDSALAHFLIKRAFLDQTRVGHFFFWQLKSELNAPAVSERFSLLLESYLKSCGRVTREQLQAQNDVLGKLNRIAIDIKGMRRGLGGVSLDDRRGKLQAMLKEMNWPRRFLLPLDPRIECSGFIVEKCRVLGSKTLPLWLAFENAETGEAIYVIYKVGDDLRQDQLTLQMIALMDDLWKREGIDLKLKPYACMAIGDDNGLIEVVKNANTTSNINIELGGVRAVYSDTTLVKWLKKHNPTDKQYARAVETFLLSCAGYSVITFALGFADRHNDNIMLTKQGNLFHIDFGHFLGHYRKLFGVTYVDKAELVFIPQYYAVIGKDNFPRFERTCTQAYNVIRRHANYFITLFSLMLSSGLPEVQSVDDIRFMQERLRLDLSETDAADFFRQILQEARANSTIKLNHAFHVLYQGMRS